MGCRKRTREKNCIAKFEPAAPGTAAIYIQKSQIFNIRKVHQLRLCGRVLSITPCQLSVSFEPRSTPRCYVDTGVPPSPRSHPRSRQGSPSIAGRPRRCSNRSPRSRGRGGVTAGAADYPTGPSTAALKAATAAAAASPQRTTSKRCDRGGHSYGHHSASRQSCRRHGHRAMPPLRTSPPPAAPPSPPVD